MFNRGDIVKARLIDSVIGHYLVLDNAQMSRYTLLCLDSGGIDSRLKYWLDSLGTKVA